MEQMVIAQKDSATGWYRKGDKAVFVREIAHPTVSLMEVKLTATKRKIIVYAPNWGWQ